MRVFEYNSACCDKEQKFSKMNKKYSNIQKLIKVLKKKKRPGVLCLLATHKQCSTNLIFFFNYTSRITPKCTTNLRAHLRIIAPAGNTALSKEMSQRWQAIGNTVSDLKLRSTAPEMNALPLDQLPVHKYDSKFFCLKNCCSDPFIRMSNLLTTN